MKNTLSNKWLLATLIRTVKTVAETAVGMLVTFHFMGEVPWLGVISASCLSGIICILTCFAGLPEVNYDED